ncbi:DUF4350 domain-containing protein [Parapedobacter tibetensis]|uniref:DUF4350 domain-containing protein n=1 Tax=Parapedobacter tibetensis TaxID=2972951 RepID=UPI00214D451F|nr:DUF4350 domain-containing protein [Parapedobacter tibetensis]
MKDLKLYTLVALLALGGFLYIQYNRPSPTNWSKTYVRTDKIPYGTYILHQELPRLFGDISVKPYQKRVYNTIEEFGDSADGYMIIAPQIDTDVPDYEKIINYVEQGNDMLMATYEYSPVFADSLGLRPSGGFSLGDDSLTAVSFTNPNLNPAKKYRYDRHIGSDYFAKFDTTRTVVLASNDKGNAIFLRYKIGQGNLYLLSSPDYFTNYALLTTDGAEFAAKALSYLHPTKQIIWDDYQTLGDLGQQSPIRVFLNDRNLRPAYFIALFSLLAFVLYGIKRRQRVIPIADPLKNTSIEFAKVVSSVYYHQRDNRDILAKQYIYFMEYLRTTYRIEGTYSQMKTNEPDMAFVQQLSARSGVDERVVLRIIQGMHDVHSGNKIDDNTLIAYNRYIEDFYQQTLWKNNISNNARTLAGSTKQ